MNTKKKRKEGIIPLKFGEGVCISYKEKSFFYGEDGIKDKTVYQVLDKNGNPLSPEVDEVVYDEEKKVILYEDHVRLDNQTSITFRFMTDLKGVQVGFVQNDYESEMDLCILLTGNFERDKDPYIEYKESLQKRLQTEIKRRKTKYIENQNGFINLLNYKGIREE